MAIDPRIALGVNPPVIAPLQLRSPIDQLGQMISLRNLMQQGDLRGLQVQQAQQELEQGRQAAQSEANFRALYTDPNATPTRSQVYGTLGPKGAAVVKTQNEIAADDEKRRENYLRIIGQAGLASKNQQDRDLRINMLVKGGVIPQDTANLMLEQPFNLEETQAFGQQFMSMADQLKEKREAADQAFKEKKQPLDLRTATAQAQTAEQTAAGTQPITRQQKIANDLAEAATDRVTLQVGGKPHEVLVNKRTGEIVKDLGESGVKPPTFNVNAATGLLDRESARFAKPHEKSISDATSQLEKINEARSMINGPATAQALGIPKVLTALVSGQGSGVRITQAELNSIAKARGIGGDIEGFIRKVSGGGTLTPEQQKQLTQVLDDAAVRLREKQKIANDALDRINSAGSRDEIVAIDKEARKRLGDTGTGGGGLPEITYQAAYDALPKGAQYTHNGEVLTKK